MAWTPSHFAGDFRVAAQGGWCPHVEREYVDTIPEVDTMSGDGVYTMVSTKKPLSGNSLLVCGQYRHHLLGV